MFNAYLTALILGSVHAVEVDHMVAVSVFTGFKPKLKAAASYGARWGLGHGIVVVLAGGVLAWLDIKVPEKIVVWGECFVGLALIILGCWAMRAATRFHAHLPLEHVRIEEKAHGHLHSHEHKKSHKKNHEKNHEGHNHQHSHIDNKNNTHHVAVKHHQHLPTAMGALHGLAGSAPVLALIPITLLVEFKQAIIYLLLFSIATTLSMTLYSVLAAAAMQGFQRNNKSIRMLTIGIAGVTIAVGIGWIIRAIL
ncbi:hydantoin utilization protein A [Aurantivibrio infirmus]